MKKQLLYLFLVITFISCSDNVKFNNPAFEGQKDNVFWRAVNAKASISARGSLTIEAYTKNEVLTLKTNAITAQTYPLGTSTSKIATYVLTSPNGATTFSTGIGIGNGEIVIEEYDAINNTVTGTFKFNAVNSEISSSVGAILNFQHGRFYKTPIVTSL